MSELRGNYLGLLNKKVIYRCFLDVCGKLDCFFWVCISQGVCITSCRYLWIAGQLFMLSTIMRGFYLTEIIGIDYEN